jgi:myo-inositol-1(or 4)-monophosphatase
VPLPDSTDWLGFCRRAAGAARDAVQGYANTAARAVETGRGEGGDTAYVIDRAAEDAVIAELEARRADVTVVSEERGEMVLGGGGPTRVVIDPVDGSLNAKRGLPFACVSIAVASGAAMQDVDVGVVAELDPRRDWWALRGGGAWRDGERLPPLDPGPLEVLGLETARPRPVAAAAGAIATMEARRVRALGSVALSLCLVAAGRLDAMLTLRAVRSVDAAAGQLLVREAGGAVSFPEAAERPSLGLDMRSRVLAARDPRLLARLLAAFEAEPGEGPEPAPGEGPKRPGS